MRKLPKRLPALLLAAALLAAVSGCQPNPTMPPVVGKGNLEDKIKDRTPGPTSGDPAATAAASEGPQRILETFQNGKLAVRIDAAPELPPAEKLPVVKVTPRKFTEAELGRFIQVLFEGKPAYKPKDGMTKAEIEHQLVYMKALKAQAKEGDRILEKIDMSIEYYENELATAPETIERELSDGKFKTDELGGMDFNASAPLGKGQEASLSVYCSETGRTASLWFTNEDMGESYLGSETRIAGAPRGVTMTFDGAKALAEKTVRDVGSDLKLAGSALGTSRGGMGRPNLAEQRQAWLFMFAREVNGVLSTYESDFGANIPQEDIDRAEKGAKDYIEPHPYERILIAIGDTGILEFQWVSPDTVLETVSEDAQTIPLEQVVEIFEKQFFIRNALRNKADVKPMTLRDGTVVPFQDESKFLREAGIFTAEAIGYAEDIASCTFNVDRVVLGLSRIAVKDKPDEFLILPVWDFFGTVTVEYTSESGYEGFTSTDTNHSFLTVNAIDGSIINRSYGY